MFINTFEYKVLNIKKFYFILNTKHIYYFMTYYKNYIKSYINIITNIYLAIIINYFNKFNFIILTTLKKLIINLKYFNYYG